MFRLVTLLILNIIIIGELVSIYFSGGLIDYQFYVNLNFQDIVAGLSIFKYQALLSVLCFVTIVFIGYKASAWLNKRLSYRYSLALLVLFALSLSDKNGPLNRGYEIIEVTAAHPLQFSRALHNAGMSAERYRDKLGLTASAGKNVIVISMESLEQGFLSPQFAGLTPNLTKLSQRFTYFPNMPMLSGSTWTLASLYTYMTGVPLLLGGYSTSLFEDKKYSTLISLGDILNTAGYQTRYIIGQPEFAGIGQAIGLFGIPVISEKTYPNRYPAAPFGLYDRDIFDLAKHEIEQLNASPQPFALFISTVSTHAPNGFYDRRMASVIKPQSSDLEFAVASLDYNIGLFVDYLEQNHLLDNTVIYLFPDHLMMGYGTQTISKLSQQPRKLYLITNAAETTLQKSVDQTIYQIDLPRLIINGAEIDTNAQFLTDFLADENKPAFIATHKSDIAALNSSSLLNKPPSGG